MSEQGNGQLPLAKRTVRNRVSSRLWEQIKTAYVSGIDFREIARNMDIPEGTILSRAKREAWPGDALSCFAFSDDYSFGILQSGIHWSWFIATCSKLKGDFRYTPESVFDTFPWPQKPKHEDIKAVAEAAVTLRALRQETMRKLNYSLPPRAIFRLVFSV